MSQEVEPSHPGLRPPRIGLATLFIWITALAVYFAILRLVGPLGGAAVTLLVLTAGAHVAGNALGTRLRDQSDQWMAAQRRDRARRRRAREHEFAPQSQLSFRKSLGKSMVVLTAIGTAVGATSGGILLTRVNQQLATIWNIALGTVSFGVLGGLAGFWISSFLRVFIGAWYDAQKERDN